MRRSRVASSMRLRPFSPPRRRPSRLAATLVFLASTLTTALNVRADDPTNEAPSLRLVVQQGNFEIHGATFAPGGRMIVTRGGSTAILWSTASGLELQRFQHPEDVREVVFSPDGTRILTGSADGAARLWNLLTGTEIGQFDGPVSR